MENYEILHCKNIIKTSQKVQLKHINFNICNDEFVSFYGMNDQTIPMLISIISGMEVSSTGSVYYAENYHPSNCRIDTRLFRNTRMVKDLSIAENIGIIGPAINPFTKFSTIKNEDSVAKIFKEFQLDYNPNTPLIELNMVEIYILEILHIYLNGGKIIFLMDFYLFSESEQKEILSKILTPLKKNGIIFVFVNYSITHNMYISDRIFIFNEGRLCKTLYKGEFSIRDLNNVFTINDFSDSMILNYKKKPLGNENTPTYSGDVIPLDLSMSAPQITGIFLENYSTQRGKKLLLKTNFSSAEIDLLTLTSTKPQALIKQKICIIAENFENLLFKDLTVHENITITKLRELSFFKLVINTHFYRYLIQSRRAYSTHVNINQLVETINHFDRFCILLDRILLLKCKTVIINFPHAFCDSKELNLLESFMDKLKSEQVHVILLSDNYLFLQKKCDHLILYNNSMESE